MTQGTLYIVAAPSGGGKTSLIQALLQAMDDIEVSVSHTTREQRKGEEQGKHYHFVDDKTFESMVNAGEFIEHATVFDASYGTAKQQIMNKLAQGIDVLLDIDWQGAQQIRSLFKRVESIFILPPSLDVLKARLEMRGRETADLIAKRMEKAQDEMSHAGEFDYLVINADFDRALAELKSVVIAGRVRYSRQMERHRVLLSKLTKIE